MTIYWLLLASAAVMAFLFPNVHTRHGLAAGQALALLAFALFYVLVSFLRYEVGADWYAYVEMYHEAQNVQAEDAFSISDPLFSLILWVSAQLGWGVYFPNAVCSLVLIIGVIVLATKLRQPWLAVVASVPYLLIVVGFGYVRQGAAIGLILMAVASVATGATMRSIFLLLVAGLFHSTAVCALPFFAFALVNRNKLQMFVITALGTIAGFWLLADRLALFERTYIDNDYQSGGAWMRISLSAVASFFILIRWKDLDCPPQTRAIWIGLSMANFLALLLLFVVDLSTAIDRISLYFSLVQLLFFANITEIMRFSGKMKLFGRFLVVATAVAVQLVWLVFATHADSWVPYKTMFG